MSIVLDGTNDYAIVNSTPVTAFPATLVAWSKKSALSVSAQQIAEVNNGTTTHYFRIQWAGGSDAAVATRNDATGGNSATTVATAADITTWHHVAGIFTSSTATSVFLDGASKDASGATSRTPTGLANIRIGTNASSASDYSGRIGHVALWNIALADADVVLLAAGANPLTIQAANLVAYWPMTDSTTPGVDVVSGTYSLTLNNNAAYDADDPTVDPAPSTGGNAKRLLTLGIG